MLPNTPIVDEEEQPAMQDGSTKRAAEVRPILRGPRSNRRGVFIQPGIGIEVRRLSLKKTFPMELVRSAFGSHYHLATVGIAIFCSVISGNHPELSQRVSGWGIGHPVINGIVDV